MIVKEANQRLGVEMKTAPSKSCPSCNERVHARKSECSCGHLFYERKNKVITDWKSLKAGDTIRSVYGNGPYYINPETKEKTYMGSYGKFVVNYVGDNYIRCQEIGRNRMSGTVILYMGDGKKSLLCDNLYKYPHKLIRVSLKRKGES